VLTSLGFEVSLGIDRDRSQMDDLLIRFAREARAADTALVYYAGHGLQHQGINYLARSMLASIMPPTCAAWSRCRA